MERSQKRAETYRLFADTQERRSLYPREEIRDNPHFTAIRLLSQLVWKHREVLRSTENDQERRKTRTAIVDKALQALREKRPRDLNLLPITGPEEIIYQELIDQATMKAFDDDTIEHTIARERSFARRDALSALGNLGNEIGIVVQPIAGPAVIEFSALINEMTAQPNPSPGAIV